MNIDKGKIANLFNFKRFCPDSASQNTPIKDITSMLVIILNITFIFFLVQVTQKIMSVQMERNFADHL